MACNTSMALAQLGNGHTLGMLSVLGLSCWSLQADKYLITTSQLGLHRGEALWSIHMDQTDLVMTHLYAESACGCKVLRFRRSHQMVLSPCPSSTAPRQVRS